MFSLIFVWFSGRDGEIWRRLALSGNCHSDDGGASGEGCIN